MSTESPPPLLVTPTEKLSQAERDEFNREVLDIGKATDGVVVSVPYPIMMYHRIDGVWLPVADLGSFHSPAPAPSAEPTVLADQDALRDDSDEDEL